MHTLSVDIVPERDGNKKKRIRIPVLIAVIAIIVAGIAVFALKNEGKIYIGYVKGGSPELYPDITYGQAFDNFFSNPKWGYFESDDGQDVCG